MGNSENNNNTTLDLDTIIEKCEAIATDKAGIVKDNVVPSCKAISEYLKELKFLQSIIKKVDGAYNKTSCYPDEYELKGLWYELTDILCDWEDYYS